MSKLLRAGAHTAKHHTLKLVGVLTGCHFVFASEAGLGLDGGVHALHGVVHHVLKRRFVWLEYIRAEHLLPLHSSIAKVIWLVGVHEVVRHRSVVGHALRSHILVRVHSALHHDVLEVVELLLRREELMLILR
jgi:hypothetical protein